MAAIQTAMQADGYRLLSPSVLIRTRIGTPNLLARISKTTAILILLDYNRRKHLFLLAGMKSRKTDNLANHEGVILPHYERSFQFRTLAFRQTAQPIQTPMKNPQQGQQ